MKSLSEICEIHLMRYHTQIDGVPNVPYRLIKQILEKMKVEQLRRMEASNVFLIFEDDELWCKYLKLDFPTNVQDVYVSKKDKILEYYRRYIMEKDPELIREEPQLLNNWLTNCIKKDVETNRYRLPYRMLYEKYERDVIEKQEESARRLRQQMRHLEEQRQKKQTETIEGAAAAAFAASMGKRTHNNSGRSELFKRSLKDHKNRLQHFKSGGFDIAHRLKESEKKPANPRLAFGGTAGSGTKHTRENIPHTTPSTATNINTTPTTKPLVKKRRPETQPNIFLNQKRLKRKTISNNITSVPAPAPAPATPAPALAPAALPRPHTPPQRKSPSPPVKIPHDPKIGKRKKSSFFHLK